MTHTLQLELPEEIYESLVRTAEEAGRQPEVVAIQWLANAANENAPYDSFAQFIGAISTEKWADRHDELLGQHLMEEMMAKDVDDPD